MPFFYSALMRTAWLKQLGRWCCLGLVFGFACVGYQPDADAACVVDRPAGDTKADLALHLSPDCTSAERERYAVRGEDIIDAITQGGRIDLVGVIVRGDLLFDRLAVHTVSSTQLHASGTQSEDEQATNQEQRIVRTALHIKDSEVLGAIRHQSAKGLLVFEQSVDFQGSRFKQGVDLSRSVFLGPVELSRSTFEQEVYFVQGRFSQPFSCRETRFGPSTRFHRSLVHGSVDCTGALFDGMAEFLEINFEQPVAFERARFGLGTGFSGSRFKRRVRFDDAIFSRETFFSFTIFEQEVVFAGAQFLGAVDFSNAEFQREDDLARARFDRPPLLAQTKRLTQDRSDGLFTTQTGQYALTVGLLVLAALLVVYAMRMK